MVLNVFLEPKGKTPLWKSSWLQAEHRYLLAVTGEQCGSYWVLYPLLLLSTDTGLQSPAPLPSYPEDYRIGAKRCLVWQEEALGVVRETTLWGGLSGISMGCVLGNTTLTQRGARKWKTSFSMAGDVILLWSGVDTIKGLLPGSAEPALLMQYLVGPDNKGRASKPSILRRCQITLLVGQGDRWEQHKWHPESLWRDESQESPQALSSNLILPKASERRVRWPEQRKTKPTATTEMSPADPSRILLDRRLCSTWKRFRFLLPHWHMRLCSSHKS